MIAFSSTAPLPAHWFLRAVQELGARAALRRFAIRCRTCGSFLADAPTVWTKGRILYGRVVGPPLSVGVECHGFDACGTVTSFPWPDPDGPHPLHPPAEGGAGKYQSTVTERGEPSPAEIPEDLWRPARRRADEEEGDL
jgi:hypothetical protein